MLEVSPLSGRQPRQLAVSVVVPAFNEAAGLAAFHTRLQRALAGVASWEVIYVDDGSTDTTRSAIEALYRSDARIALVSLSRNFGKETAITAGLDHASGDAVVVIDADLQDPPELIPELIAGLAVGFRHGLRQAPKPSGGDLAEAGDIPGVLSADAAAWAICGCRRTPAIFAS